jgi:hypothetical protein
LCLLLLPVLLSVNATDVGTMLLFDVPLCMAPVSSLAAFYMLAETAQGRPRSAALKLLPALIALGAGLSPHLARAVNEGLAQSAGEFVRTPKRGLNRWRYAAASELPLFELLIGSWTLGAVVVSLWRGHYFATPFAALFTFGYGYIAYLVIAEQRLRRRLAAPAAQPSEVVTLTPEAPPSRRAA